MHGDVGQLWSRARYRLCACRRAAIHWEHSEGGRTLLERPHDWRLLAERLPGGHPSALVHYQQYTGLP